MDFLLKQFKAISGKNKKKLTYAEKIKFLSYFQEEDDLIHRSYNQYLCGIKESGKVITILNNFFSFILMLYYIIFKRNDKYDTNEEKNIAFFKGTNPKLIPEELKCNLYIISNYNKFHLKRKKRFKIVFSLLKVSKSPYFICKNLITTGLYDYYILSYKPNFILNCNEYSFCSSFITEYVSAFNIENINIMHGERLFELRCCFNTYHKFYVWDDYYIELLKKMKTKSNFYKYIPDFFIIHRKNSVYDYTYYLQAQSKDQRKIIFQNLKILKSYGYSIAIRLHPIYNNEIEKEFYNDFFVQDSSTSIVESLAHTKNVISAYSTVMIQAHLSGINVIIDDSDIDLMDYLLNCGWIGFKKYRNMLTEELVSSKRGVYGNKI